MFVFTAAVFYADTTIFISLRAEKILCDDELFVY